MVCLVLINSQLCNRQRVSSLAIGTKGEATDIVVNIPDSRGPLKGDSLLDILPHELGAGMSDPDAVSLFTSMEKGSNKKSRGGKNPGAAKKGRKENLRRNDEVCLWES